jgi:hypothetical protein
MGTTFASKRYANGVCDMCGQVYKLKQLLKEVYNQRFTGFLVCPDCWDEDNPQLQLGRYPINDPQALENPRPDAGVLISRNLFGFNPVGNPSTTINAQMGHVSVNGVVV